MKKGIISRNIGLLMEHFGIRNESQLAKKVGMPQTTVNKLITGVSADPRVSTLAPIAEHFKIPLDALLNEHPRFDLSKKNEFLELRIPLISYDELIEVHDNLKSLNNVNWPHWYPIPKQSTENYYAVQLNSQELPSPFDRASVLIIQNETDLQNNMFCIVKHISSSSVNIKKVLFQNGKKWLIALQSELPAVEFDSGQWIMLGTIKAVLTDMTNGNFLSVGEKE